MQSQKQKSSADYEILSLFLFGFPFILFIGLVGKFEQFCCCPFSSHYFVSPSVSL